MIVHCCLLSATLNLVCVFEVRGCGAGRLRKMNSRWRKNNKKRPKERARAQNVRRQCVPEKRDLENTIKLGIGKSYRFVDKFMFGVFFARVTQPADLFV